MGYNVRFEKPPSSGQQPRPFSEFEYQAFRAKHPHVDMFPDGGFEPDQ